MDQKHTHDPTAPRQMLKRYLGSWHQRLAVGVSIDSDFSNVGASLSLCKGYGKWLQHQWSGFRQLSVPVALKQACQRLCSDQDVNLIEFTQVRADLTDVIASAVDNVITMSGKAEDRLLTVGVVDPGLWNQDFDGKPNYVSFCEPERLAELSGLTVIDSFSARDIAGGGQGKPIEPLALWLLFADRSPKVATQDRVVVLESGQDSVSATWLPVSDGLDDEIPNIRVGTFKKSVDLPTRLKEWVNGLAENRSKRLQIGLVSFAKVDLAESNEYWEQVSIQDRGLDLESIDSTIAATLSLMSLDQMPSSLPWITGCDAPRVLGRMTPGSANNWRQVILNMADFRPPAMKLRDAI